VTAMARVTEAGPCCSARLERVFDACFATSENTRLRGGCDEPLYVPAGDDSAGAPVAWHRLFYREDYFASALHEVSHWCIAGPERRLLRDFGYWYAPDGRSAEQQAAFQRVEVRPQALEWCLSRACGYAFRVSLDNLEGDAAARASEQAFKAAVVEEAGALVRRGLPPRARRFFHALSLEFGTGLGIADLRFSPGELG
jgi:elongation factor P hydroxylase